MLTVRLSHPNRARPSCFRPSFTIARKRRAACEQLFSFERQAAIIFSSVRMRDWSSRHFSEISPVGTRAGGRSKGSAEGNARWGRKSGGRISGVSNTSCGRAKWADGRSVSGTHLVDENRVDSNAEVDRLVGCIFAKAALQQNATTQLSSFLALFIWRAQRLRSLLSGTPSTATATIANPLRIIPRCVAMPVWKTWHHYKVVVTADLTCAVSDCLTRRARSTPRVE